MIEDVKAKAWVDNMLGVLITPGGSEWWREAQFYFSPLVRETLNQRLANAGTLPPPWTQFPP